MNKVRSGTTPPPSKKDFVDRLWELFGSMRFAIWVLVAAAVLSLLALLLSELLPPTIKQGDLARLFNLSDPFRSWWFRILLAVLSVSLFVCVFQRGPLLIKQAFSRTFRTSASLFIGLPSVRSFTSKDGERNVLDIMRQLGLSAKTLTTDDGMAISGVAGGISRLGPLLSHLGMLLLILGGLASSITGYNTSVAGKAGDIVALPEWGFSLRIDDFRLKYFPVGLNQWVEAPDGNRGQVAKMRNDSALVKLHQHGHFHETWYAVKDLRNDFLIQREGTVSPFSGNVKSYITDAVVLQNDQEVRKVQIEVNHPLRVEGYRFYQSSYEMLGMQTVVDTVVLLVSMPNSDEMIVNIPVGGEAVSLPWNDYHIQIARFFTHFRLDQHNQPFNASGRLENPAARARILQNDSLVSEQWVFRQNLGAMGHTETPLTIVMHDLRGVRSETGGYRTILTVNKEGGRWLIWWGLILASIGLVLSYITTHRQVWALVVRNPGQDDQVLITGYSTKQETDFRNRLTNVINSISEINIGHKRP